MIAILSAASASASVVYSNGPDAGDDTYYTIDGPYEVSDSFTLTSGASIYQIILQVDTQLGDTPNTLDWLITTAAFGGTTVASATGAPLDATFDHYWSPSGTPIGAVYQVSFDVPDVYLAAGTYWLEIQNSGNLAWATGANDLGSADVYNTVTTSITPLGETESFELLTPEPASFLLFGFGILALGFSRRFFAQKA